VNASSSILSLTLAGNVNAVVNQLEHRNNHSGIEEKSQPELKKANDLTALVQSTSRALTSRNNTVLPVPTWHAPWKLHRVIAGHLGWVRCLAVDPSNDWFASGSADRCIKIWDIATGSLKLTLTGHASPVRALEASAKYPYLFSAGEDKMIKCWDLEQNKTVRQFHGHNAGVYALAIHPTLDLIATGGRDAICRVWDIRTRSSVFTLSGHDSGIMAVKASSVEPQIITSSMDGTIRLWDMVAGKPRAVLTHHKKGVRCLLLHPTDFAMISASADAIKKFALPDGVFVSNYKSHNAIINSLAINADNVMVSGGDDGTLK
jgi:pleiotropic regulator 1